MVHEEKQNTFVRDFAALIGLMVILGSLFQKALFSGQTLVFKAAFVITVASLYLAVYSISSFIQHRKKRPKPWKVHVMLPLATVLSVVIFGTTSYVTKTNPAKELDEALQIRRALVDSFSGFRVGIIAKVKRYTREVFISSETEFRYQLVRIESDGTEQIYKQVQPSGDKIMFIDGIEPGRYDVRLVFYGLIFDRSEVFNVGGKVSHLIALTTPGHDVRVFFEVFDEKDRPLEGKWIQIVGPNGQQIRGDQEYSQINSSGRTTKPLWIPPLPYEEKNSYKACIFEGDTLIAEKEFRIEGNTEFYDKITVKIRVNTISKIEEMKL